MTSVKNNNNKNYARTYIMSELEKKISTTKLESHERKLNYVKLDLGTKKAPAKVKNSEADKTASSRIPIKPKPPISANKPNISAISRTTGGSSKKPLIPQRTNNVIYSKPKSSLPSTAEVTSKATAAGAAAAGAGVEVEKPKVQHLARKFSALGKGSKTHQVTRKISDPTGLSSEQTMIHQNLSNQDDRRNTMMGLTPLTEAEELNKSHKTAHPAVAKNASADSSQQLFPPQILISQTGKHGSQDSGFEDCLVEKKQQISSSDCDQAAEKKQLNFLSTPPSTAEVEAHTHKRGSYLKVEYQKPTNSTIEAFNIHLFEEEEDEPVLATSETAVAASSMYGSATDDEKVQYMYFNGSQESSCTVNSTDTDGYSLMKCRRVSTDTYVEINNLALENEQLPEKHKTMESVRVEPGYLAAYRPESTAYVDQHCNPVKREDYWDEQGDDSAVDDYSFNSMATLPHPKSPRKLSLIKDSNGYIHEHHLPMVESTALRKLVRHGNRLGSGELYSYAKVPGIIIPTINKNEPIPAWGVEPPKKKSVLKKPPPIQPKSDSIRRSIMQHHCNYDNTDRRHTLNNIDHASDNSGGNSPNGFSSLDGPVFIDKFKTLETFGRDRSFSEFHTVDQKAEMREEACCSPAATDDYVSITSQQSKWKAKKYKKPYKLPPNVTSTYATIGAPVEYDTHEEDMTSSPMTSPPLSPPKPIPAPRKQHIIDQLPTVARSTNRDRSKSLHDLADTLDFDGPWKPHPIRDRAKLVSRRKRKALKRTFSSENLLEHSTRNEASRCNYAHWNKCGTFDTSDFLSQSLNSDIDSSLEHSDSSIDQSRRQPISRRVPLNDSVAKQQVMKRAHSQEDINYLATITGYDIPCFRTKKPYVNLPPIITANVEIGPLNFTLGNDNIYDVPRVPPTLDMTKDSAISTGGEAECTYTSGTFTHKGGMLTSAGSGVQIEIPEGAIARGKTQQLWFAVCQEIEGFNMNSVDSRMQSNSRMFEQGRNRIEVTPRVLVGPKGVQFLKPIRIIIPHCISPLHASWEFTALVRKEDSDETEWEEVCQQIINPLWSKKAHRRQYTYRHSKYQLMLHEVMFTSLYPGWFVLAGEAIRSGQRTAKIMTLVIYCSKQEFDNVNTKLTLFVLLANNTIDDRKVNTSYYIIITSSLHCYTLHHITLQVLLSILRSDDYVCLEENLPVLCYGNGRDMELTLIHERKNRPLQTKVRNYKLLLAMLILLLQTIPYGKLWRQRRIGQAWTTLEIMAHMRPTLPSVSLQVNQVGSHDIQVESICLEN